MGSSGYTSTPSFSSRGSAQCPFCSRSESHSHGSSSVVCCGLYLSNCNISESSVVCTTFCHPDICVMCQGYAGESPLCQTHATRKLLESYTLQDTLCFDVTTPKEVGRCLTPSSGRLFLTSAQVGV
jgi:hypothetical protein